MPYPQPYVIEAVGDVGDLTGAIADDDYLQVYREQADDPTIAVGWDLDIEDEVTAPAYDGLLDLSLRDAGRPARADGPTPPTVASPASASCRSVRRSRSGSSAACRSAAVAAARRSTRTA